MNYLLSELTGSIPIIPIHLGLEFIYAQSPDSMKGLLTGLFYFIFGGFSGLGATVYLLIRSDVIFYSIVIAVAAVGLFLYCLVSFCYSNRRRPTNDESEKEILHRSYAASVYLS